MVYARGSSWPNLCRNQARRDGLAPGRRTGPGHGREGPHGRLREGRGGGRGATLETGPRHVLQPFPRRALGEGFKTSGNAIHVARVLVDCDADCLVYAADPDGPSCHTGAPSCFFQALEGESLVPLRDAEAAAQTVLALEATLEARKHATGKASYTKCLYDAGAARIGEKSARRPTSSRSPSRPRPTSASCRRRPTCST